MDPEWPPLSVLVFQSTHVMSLSLSLKTQTRPWPVAQLVGASLWTPKVVGSIPGQGSRLGCRLRKRTKGN